MNVTVLIRCHNESEWIGHCIQSVIDHIKDPEIIVLDNNSTDASMDIVRMFEHHCNVQTLSISNYSPGISLNTGVSKSSNQSILVLSAHCVLKEFDPLESFSYLDKYVAIFGKQIPVYRGKRIMPRYIWSHFSDNAETNMFSTIENRYFLHNAFCIYNKDFLLKEPFDCKLYGKEDRYWAKSTIDKGFNILYNPDMKCYHHWTSNGATWKGIG